MNTITVSATAARNNFFTLIEKVINGTTVIIKKDNKEVAVLSLKNNTRLDELIKASNATHGLFKNDPGFQRPFEGKQASKFLGKWDKDL